MAYTRVAVYCFNIHETQLITLNLIGCHPTHGVIDPVREDEWRMWQDGERVAAAVEKKEERWIG